MEVKKNKRTGDNTNRKAYRMTVDEKKEIIADYESGVCLSDLAVHFNLARSTVSSILKNKEAIKAADVAKGVTVLTKQRPQLIDSVEKLLLAWINEKQEAGENVKEAIIREKAKNLYNDLVAQTPSTSGIGCEDFKASRGWFDKFCKRSGILQGKGCRERWSRVRDNHRKALSIRKIKNGDAHTAIKMNPLNYNQELNYMVQYMNDNETYPNENEINNDNDHNSNLSSENDFEEMQHEPTESNDTQVSTPISFMTTPQKTKRKWNYVDSQRLNTIPIIQEHILKRETANNRDQFNTITNFFLSMAKIVSTFPLQDQVTVKSHVFQIVNNVEMRLAVLSSSMVPSGTLDTSDKYFIEER